MPKVKSTKKVKRLFFDIETSPNVLFSWNIGYNVTIGHENIIKERAIICICWKWAGEKTVHSLKWNKGDDKQMLVNFIKILDSADEIIGHNSDKFDERWIRTRAIYHGVPMMPKYQSLDTLKLAKSGFKFNNNRLDYIGGFLGVGRKMDTGGFGLWKSIVLDNNTKSMDTMIEYCKKDVVILEKVFDKLNPYTKSKVHHGVLMGHDKLSCPNCGSDSVVGRGVKLTASGVKKHALQCNDCGKYFQLSQDNYEKLKLKNKK